MTPRPSQTHCASHCAVPQAPRGAGSPASLARVGPRRPEVCVFPHRGGLRRPRLVKYEFSKETRSPLEGNESPQPGMKGGADGSAGHSRDGRVCAPTDPRHQHEPPAMPPGLPLAATTTLSVSLSRPTSRPPRRCSPQGGRLPRLVGTSRAAVAKSVMFSHTAEAAGCPGSLNMN